MKQNSKQSEEIKELWPLTNRWTFFNEFLRSLLSEFSDSYLRKSQIRALKKFYQCNNIWPHDPDQTSFNFSMLTSALNVLLFSNIPSAQICLEFMRHKCANMSLRLWCSRDRLTLMCKVKKKR